MMNTYFTYLLDVTGKQPVWSEYTFPASTTLSNTIYVSVFLGSVVFEMVICVDIEFFLFG